MSTTVLRNKTTGSADYAASGLKTPAGAATSATKATVAPAATSAGSYGIDKRTGMAIGPENDTPSGPRKANDVAPIDPTNAGVPQVPGGPEIAPPTAPTGSSMQGNTASITDPLTGQKFSRDTTVAGSTYQPNKYQQALQTAQSSGIQAPSEGGIAKMQTQGMMPNQQDTSMVDSFISQDPNVNTLMQGITQLLNPQKQTSTLMQDYQKLYKQSGLDEINHELIDADTVINGTEQDIRNEIQTAGGFGTDSQVQAMSLARNKGLLTRYNQLVQQKTDATNQLNTLSQLNVQDKQMAQTRLNTQINAMFSLANFQQQAQNNTREAFNGMVAKIGYAGAYAAYSTNPQQLSNIENIMGLGSGGLQKLAAQPDYNIQSQQLDVQLKKAQIANTYSEIDARNSASAGTLNGKPQTAIQSQVQGYADRINQADQILNNFGSKFTGAFANYSTYLPNFLKSSDRQQYEQAERNFVNAVLRRESGAAISPSEFDSAAAQYFPQGGDQAAVVAQKAANRQTVIDNLYQQSNIPRQVLPGQVIQGDDGKNYKVGDDGETITPI